MLWLLLKNKLNIISNNFLKVDLSRRRRSVLAMFGFGFLFYLLFQWTFEIFTVLITFSPDGLTIINKLLVLYFFGFFIFLLASGVMISIHYLFVASDLPLLLSAPLSEKTIFSYKFIESIFANSTFFFFLGIPIFISYGIVTRASWYYFPLIVVNALIFLSIPVSISFLLSFIIVRVISPARAKEIMTVLLGLISLGIWLGIQMIRASQLNPNSADYSPETIENVKQMATHSLFLNLPSTWAAKSLVAFSTGDWTLIFSDFLPLLLLSLLLYFFCLSFSKNIFQKGLQLEVASNKKRKHSTAFISSSVSGTIFWRDFKLLTRDLRLFSSVFILTIMMILFPLLHKFEQPDTHTPYLWIAFFAAIISVQLTSRSIPFEGKSFWVMLLSPQPWKRLLLGKFILGYTFNLISIWIAVIISSLYFHSPLRFAILALLHTMFISFAISMYGLTMGSLFPNFEWDHPKRMLTTTGGLLLSVGSIVITGLWVGFIVAIYTIFKSYGMWLDLGGVLFSMVIAIVFFIIGIDISSKKLSKIEWKY